MIARGALVAMGAAEASAPAAPARAISTPTPHAPDGARPIFVTECLAPPPEVAAYVLTFFSLRCDRASFEFIHPATSGLLVMLVDGGLTVRTREGRVDRSYRTSLVTPLSAAADVACEGPLHCVCAALTPLGWAALTGRLSAEAWADRMVEAGTLLGSRLTALGDMLARDYRAGAIGLRDVVAQMSCYIARRASHVPAQHATLVSAVAAWLSGSLSPRIEDLIAMTAYSPRQLQRLVGQYYGLPPRHLARKYRAMRAAALLHHPDTSRDLIAQVEDHFYDQSHMIREIRHFTGCTPGRLTHTDHPSLKALLDLHIYAQSWPCVVVMPPGLDPYGTRAAHRSGSGTG